MIGVPFKGSSRRFGDNAQGRRLPGPVRIAPFGDRPRGLLLQKQIASFASGSGSEREVFRERGEMFLETFVIASR